MSHQHSDKPDYVSLSHKAEAWDAIVTHLTRRTGGQDWLLGDGTGLQCAIATIDRLTTPLPESGSIEVEEQWGRQERIELLELALEQYAMRPGADGEIARIALKGATPRSTSGLRADVRALVDAVVEMHAKHTGEMMNWPEWDAMSLALHSLPESHVSSVQSATQERK